MFRIPSEMVLKSIRCDNGGEFISKEFKDFCSNMGIRIEYTSPYTSQQNGRSERYIRSITAMVRAMLRDAKLGDEFWGEALHTAVFLKNRMASRTLNWTTPYEIWYGKTPKLTNLKVFGSKAFVRTPTQRRAGKLDQQGFEAIFLGYDLTTRNYRLYNSSNGSLIKSRDVIFVENQRVAQKEKVDKNLEDHWNSDDDIVEGNFNNSKKLKNNKNKLFVSLLPLILFYTH